MQLSLRTRAVAVVAATVLLSLAACGNGEASDSAGTGGGASDDGGTAGTTVELTGFAFSPAELTVTTDAGGLWVWYEAPSEGYRLIDLDGDAGGENPLRGPLTVTLDMGDSTTSQTITPEVFGTRSRLTVDATGAVSVTVSDAAGNSGSLPL